MLNTNTAEQFESGFHKAVVALTVTILKPLVRILLRHGMSFPEFAEIGRWVFVDVAMNSSEFSLPGRKLSKSRVAVLTGLSRKEVLRLSNEPSPDEADELKSYNRAARVLSGWTEDPLFCDGPDKPRILPIRSGNASFADLVRLYSGDMPHKAILDELVRCGAVEILNGERIRLRTLSYLPSDSSQDQLEIIRMCGRDLLATMEHNTHPVCEVKFPQRAVYSSRIPDGEVADLRAFVRRETDTLARRVHHYIIEHSDEVRKPDVRYHRAGLGLYYFES